MALILRPPGTPLSLAERLRGLARWQRVWAVAAGLASLLAFVGSAVALVVLLDLASTLPSWQRALALATILAGSAVIVASAVVKPWRRRSTSQSVALALEAKH